MAKLIKSLELQYPIIQFLIQSIIPLSYISYYYYAFWLVNLASHGHYSTASKI